MSRPSTVGAISADRDTPSTMMDEAEAVRVGNVSQQRITRAGTSAPCSRPSSTRSTRWTAKDGVSSKTANTPADKKQVSR